jgi:hypothetical protein
MATECLHGPKAGRCQFCWPVGIRSRAAGGAADPGVQGRCAHAWVKITTASASGGFEFRRCSRCGMNSWLGPDGPVALDHVLKVLSR